MLDRTAMRAWEAAALAEAFREEAQEAEVETVGMVTSDHLA